MEKEIERCCGNCAWFYGEMTDGTGFCACLKGSIEFVNCADPCDMCENNYVSRQQMRHYMAVILQGVRNAADPTNRRRPDDRELVKASSFAYKYMKVFSNL